VSAPKHIAIVAVVAATGLLSALGGTAAANGGSGSATACSATSKKVVGGKFLVNLTMSNVDPSQAQFATCAHARKVAGRAASMELKTTTAAVVEGFSCSDFVLKSKPPKFTYDCHFQGVDTATEIDLRFRVAYVKEQVRRSVGGR
jgi:hypothetical protein